MANKILIANRGEIALRIIRACKELGMECVSVYSEADADSLPVKMADEAICIGSAHSEDSYLNMTNILSAAISTGCNAIHPGYGFLSENDQFAEWTAKCNLTFIGPSSKTIGLLSNKLNAKKIAMRYHIPTVPGSLEPVNSLEDAIRIANEIGYPLLLKAMEGGGGKGIQEIHNQQELHEHFDRVRLENKANFKKDGIFIEKWIANPHHIEIQLIRDYHNNIVSLGDRDCSIQRRKQKLVEESPSLFLNLDLRKQLTKDAVTLFEAVDYVGVGTVEFIVDNDFRYYFLEVNTRLQVEHPVTEMVTGVDIVREQIKIAFHQPLSIRQEDIHCQGVAIECRITAEDPLHDFLPSPGMIKNVIVPGGLGVRVDTHIYPNYVITPYYDSLLAKLIVWAPTRREAIRRMRWALEQFLIDGIQTNIELLYLLMHNPDFVRGTYDTLFLTKFIELVKENNHESII
ncbi:MAG: acetyl-CoA carboxylase biotin carboxylase subunit [Bacilli bacterium]|jgi:acetyl-CoA carboxylase biotin carboxylase subunit|nr:acetyl-CoA carboxylase biotin carboxylase subunit [Bacilli bacterium]